MKQRGVCEDCGKQTSYKTYKRCSSCARKGERNPKWGKFTSTDKQKGRKQARQRFDLGQCQKCGQPATERHHIDDNPFNNIPANILILCRRCHMIEDGRLNGLVDRNRAGRKYRDNAEKFRALRARRKAEGRPIK